MQLTECRTVAYERPQVKRRGGAEMELEELEWEEEEARRGDTGTAHQMRPVFGPVARDE